MTSGLIAGVPINLMIEGDIMAKQRKKNYKQFTIIKLEDGIIALGSLISGVAVNLKKYKEYGVEARNLLKKYEDFLKNSSEEVLIPADEYDNINDKLLFRQREILKYVSDCQKSSFSYMDLRKHLVKNKHLSSALDDKVSAILNEFLDVRNWTFHNPQSMLVATSEVSKKRIPNEIKEFVKIQPQLNPLVISHTANYDILMLISLLLLVEKRTKQFEVILEKMKKDYNEMYQKIDNKPILIFGLPNSQNVVFYEEFITHRYDDFSNDISQVSMAIQKSKYDGSDEIYNQWVINKSYNNEIAEEGDV